MSAITAGEGRDEQDRAKPPSAPSRTVRELSRSARRIPGKRNQPSPIPCPAASSRPATIISSSCYPTNSGPAHQHQQKRRRHPTKATSRYKKTPTYMHARARKARREDLTLFLTTQPCTIGVRAALHRNPDVPRPTSCYARRARTARRGDRSQLHAPLRRRLLARLRVEPRVHAQPRALGRAGAKGLHATPRLG